MHSLWLYILDNKLYMAPLNQVQMVLDACTGTGIWVMDFGDEHREAHVIGIDLSPIQPTWINPNVEFLVQDAEDEYRDDNCRFDFIHARMIFTCFIEGHRGFIERSFRNLKPGGYLEIQDEVFRPTTTKEYGKSALNDWRRELIIAAKKLGYNWDDALMYEQYMKDAGFVEIKTKFIKVPIGGWQEDDSYRGNVCSEIFLKSLQALSMACLTRSGSCSREEVELMLIDVRNDLKDRARRHFVQL